MHKRRRFWEYHPFYYVPHRRSLVLLVVVVCTIVILSEILQKMFVYMINKSIEWNGNIDRIVNVVFSDSPGNRPVSLACMIWVFGPILFVSSAPTVILLFGCQHFYFSFWLRKKLMNKIHHDLNVRQNDLSKKKSSCAFSDRLRFILTQLKFESAYLKSLDRCIKKKPSVHIKPTFSNVKNNKVNNNGFFLSKGNESLKTWSSTVSNFPPHSKFVQVSKFEPKFGTSESSNIFENFEKVNSLGNSQLEKKVSKTSSMKLGSNNTSCNKTSSHVINKCELIQRYISTNKDGCSDDAVDQHPRKTVSKNSIRKTEGFTYLHISKAKGPPYKLASETLFNNITEMGYEERSEELQLKANEQLANAKFTSIYLHPFTSKVNSDDLLNSFFSLGDVNKLLHEKYLSERFEHECSLEQIKILLKKIEYDKFYHSRELEVYHDIMLENSRLRGRLESLLNDVQNLINTESAGDREPRFVCAIMNQNAALRDEVKCLLSSKEKLQDEIDDMLIYKQRVKSIESFNDDQSFFFSRLKPSDGESCGNESRGSLF